MSRLTVDVYLGDYGVKGMRKGRRKAPETAAEGHASMAAAHQRRLDYHTGMAEKYRKRGREKQALQHEKSAESHRRLLAQHQAAASQK